MRLIFIKYVVASLFSYHTQLEIPLETRMHSTRMRTTRSSSHQLGVCLSACWDTPPRHGPGDPPLARPLNLPPPPGCGPGDPPGKTPQAPPPGVGLEGKARHAGIPPAWRPARHAGIPPPSWTERHV